MSGEVARIVIADDHRLFREGIRNLFSTVEGMEIVADIDNGNDLLSTIATHSADVALVDVSMPGPGIVVLCDQVEQSELQCALVALTMHYEPSFALSLIETGLNGYVVKDDAFEELLSAVDAVRRGDTYVSKALLEAGGSQSELTAREFACLSAAAAGDTNKMIARALSISGRTVQFHIINACRKLGAQRRSQAIAIARERGLIL
ncbi:MAG: response regulator transcription factor [Pseudomonadota bacterium]